MKLSRLKTLPAVIVIMTAATVGSTVSPAGAATTLSDGRGAFTAVAVATFVPPDPITGDPLLSNEPCSVYSAYHANLVFLNGMVVDVRSAPDGSLGGDLTWAEGPAGTYDSQAVPGSCSGPVQAIEGFTGVVTGAAGVPACLLGSGTYVRNELNVTFTFGSVSPVIAGGCGTMTATVTINTTIPRVDFGPQTLAAIAENGTLSTIIGGLPGPLGLIGGELYDSFIGSFGYASACAGLIAPPMCLLGPAGAAPLYTTP